MYTLETGSSLSRNINLMYRFHKILRELNRNTASATSNKYPIFTGHTHADMESTALPTSPP